MTAALAPDVAPFGLRLLLARRRVLLLQVAGVLVHLKARQPFDVVGCVAARVDAFLRSAAGYFDQFASSSLYAVCCACMQVSKVVLPRPFSPPSAFIISRHVVATSTLGTSPVAAVSTNRLVKAPLKSKIMAVA